MACEVNYANVRQGIIAKAMDMVTTKTITGHDGSLFVSNRDYDKKGQSFAVAQSVVKKLNGIFGETIAHRYEQQNGQFIHIEPSSDLVNHYLNHYKNTIAEGEREKINEEANVEEVDGEIEVPNNWEQVDMNGSPIRIYCN